MEPVRTRTNQLAGLLDTGLWDDDTRRLVSTIGALALGAYVFTHPRVLKFAFVLGAAELLRRKVPNTLSFHAVSSRSAGPEANSIKGRAAITIGAKPEAVYNYWRDLTNAPKFMSAVEEVRLVSDNVAVWKMRPVRGKSFSWVGETSEDKPGETIGWRIIGSDVLSGSGRVQFHPGLIPGTTEVHLALEVRLPLRVSNWVTRSLLTRQQEETLRRLRQILETGEVARTDGQPAGDRSAAGRLVHDYIKPVLIPS